MTEGTAPETAPDGAASARRRRVRLGRIALIVALAALLAGALPPLFSWQRTEEQRATSLSNLRRLAIGVLSYAQDWDDTLMPPSTQEPSGRWRTWPQLVRPYVHADSDFNNPANPVEPNTVEPLSRYPITTSYALNRRFWNTFHPGPFPLDDLELGAQTALFVEAGPMWRDPLHAPRHPADRSPFALLDYGDTRDRYAGFCPYPSSHQGRLGVVAVDGHAVLVKVEHYFPSEGPHDPLYGWIGGSLYNWNGGHPNGQTDTPIRQ